MSPVIRASLYLLMVLTISSCSLAKLPAKSETKSTQEPQPTTQTTKPVVEQGELQAGQASGNYTAKGNVVELKYAYAGRGERFGSEAITILLTEQPLPPEAVAEELKSQTLLEGEKIRGLEYVIDKDGMWIRFHPGQYQESTRNQLKDYKVEGDIVRGIDDNPGNLTDGKYARSVKFVATIVK